ncbi:SHOCT domain-containing protein [Streptomyces sp. NPDC014734]|uniref:SHOCT domain-containing protein n=1 Tax=Streptomyces sp. NPDC014734 TaxID=3364886 RepID=UPI003701E3B9
MPGLLRGVARTAESTDTPTAVSDRVSRRQAGRWARQDTAGTPQAAGPTSAPPPTTLAPEEEMSNKIAHLKELGDLRSRGVLTGGEFEAQKARLLAS